MDASLLLPSLNIKAHACIAGLSMTTFLYLNMSMQNKCKDRAAPGNWQLTTDNWQLATGNWQEGDGIAGRGDRQAR
ncbi:MAG: hypothetical protein V4488_15405 [Pseudomonadota bacterium]